MKTFTKPEKIDKALKGQARRRKEDRARKLDHPRSKHILKPLPHRKGV